MGSGIVVQGVSVNINNNHIARAQNGIVGTGSGADPNIYRNTFRRCDTGVYLISGARADLGTASGTKGFNVFRRTNGWHIYNDTAHAIKAEWNFFCVTSASQIDAKIHDNDECGSCGAVDFDPLRGGVSPTGSTHPLALATTTAVSTRAGGAEIALTLSAPAKVSAAILNIAGRPVATVARDLDTAAGLQRIVWNGRTDNGTRAPSGTYLVRIAARGSDGGQASGLCTLRLDRR
jgi:hypothetical protein